MRIIGRAFLCLAAVAMLIAGPVGAETRLILSGYDTVAYFTRGKPVKGDPAFAHEWDGGRYLFADAKHRDMFAADPDRYAPQFRGFCTSSLGKGEKIQANPEYWVISDGKLFLFGAKMAVEAFKKDPKGFEAKAAAMRSKLN
jgi:YHS domain-containing protein